MIFFANLTPVMTEIFLLISLVLLFGLVAWEGFQVQWCGVTKKVFLGNPAATLTILILTLAVFLKTSTPVSYASVFLNTFSYSPAVNFLQLSVLTTALLIAYFLRESFVDFEFWLVYLFFVLSNILILASQDLLMFYITLELQSFATYILAAFARSQQLSVEAALKYFVLGAFTSGFFLFGLALFYVAFGTTNLYDLTMLALFLEPSSLTGLAFIFLFAGFLFKLAVFPFHFWVLTFTLGFHCMFCLFLPQFLK
jgi:NADH-quinone oxidoreductase subunit N